MTTHRRTPIVLGIAAVVALAACGSGSTSPKVSTGTTGRQRPAATSTSSTIPTIPTSPASPAPELSTTTTTPAPRPSPLPSVEVLDTANGQTVQFSSLVPAVKPVLFWFWAPH